VWLCVSDVTTKSVLVDRGIDGEKKVEILDGNEETEI